MKTKMAIICGYDSYEIILWSSVTMTGVHNSIHHIKYYHNCRYALKKKKKTSLIFCLEPERTLVTGVRIYVVAEKSSRSTHNTRFRSDFCVVHRDRKICCNEPSGMTLRPFHGR